MNKHTTARIGKRIHVILKNGEVFTDKLTALKGRYYEFEQRGRIVRRAIRSFAIAKPL